MWHKRKWHSILLVGLVLLLASSVVGCAPSYTEADLQVAREAGHNTGFTEGYKAGFTAGYDEGYTKDKAVGVSSAETIAPPSTTQEPPPKIEPPPTIKLDVPAGAISAEEAKDHIGEKATVYGLVASTNYATGSRGKPTFLNLGKPYPNQIFTVLIWDNNRKNFPNPPEVYYRGKTISVTGLITSYQGVAQIEVTSPSQIQVH